MNTERKSFVKLTADDGMVLTDGSQVTSIVITTEAEAEKWREVSEEEGKKILLHASDTHQ